VVGLLKKLIGTQNDRALRALRKVVRAVNSQASLSDLDDAALRAKTVEFRQRLADGATVDDLLPEAFAVVREAADRTLGLRHFDAQLIGGAVLHQGRIAEMRTGEGKTLVATLPAYLNALTGEGVHIVTVNDYLARRDATWMGPVYRYLGLSVGVIQSFAGPGEPNSFLLSDAGDALLPVSRREAYAADILYGTNNEFGFDYLRDNMALRMEDKSQRGQAYAIVDEVDSILIDEARTPLIISGVARDSSALYQRIDKLVQALNPHSEDSPGDFTLDEKTRQVELSEDGHEKIEGLLANAGLLGPDDSLYQAGNLGLLHHVHNALRARHLFHRDIEYIVRDGEVVLIDEHTGRTMPGRRLSEGLHQAIEAKEGAKIQSESQTLASTTFQNYFRLYGKLAGMTGTADTEAYEFQQIYGLQVVVIPPNKPVIRKDLNDLIFLTQAEKYNAVVDDIVSCRDKGAPVLVGTASIESSELLSAELKGRGIEHQVLNAKFHEKEAHIIAQAGRPGTVTIATNMAGRGTDIVLGGNLQAELAALENPSEAELAGVKAAWEERHARVIAAGGLHILGTERHESRRIDNQLRGRAGRQGDPGLSRFYLAMEDNLMRLFITDRVKGMMGALGMDQGEAIEHRMVTNAVEKAQRKVEGRNFDIRKQLLEYDDVANDQRQVVYQQRDELLAADHITDIIENLHRDVVTELIDRFIRAGSLPEQWDIPGLEEELRHEMNLDLPLRQWLDADDRLHEQGLRERIQAAADAAYAVKVAEIGSDIHLIEKQVMLQVLDNHWKEHLAAMDQLRQGIGLRAYAQKNPKQEYKREAFAMFQDLLSRIKHDTVRFLVRLQVRREEDINALEQQRLEEEARQRLAFQHAEAAGLGESQAEPRADAATTRRAPAPFVREDIKVGRNEPCPCGSGKKFKQCHGKL
jgi:preprotein translocase subunit SecA